MGRTVVGSQFLRITAWEYPRRPLGRRFVVEHRDDPQTDIPLGGSGQGHNQRHRLVIVRTCVQIREECQESTPVVVVGRKVGVTRN